MKNALFHGVCTALVTPFLDGKVNYPMLEQLLRYQIESGIENVVLCGTTGEAPTLSDQEKLEIFQRAKDYVGDKMCVIAGTGSNSTEHAVYLSREAEKRGADGLLAVSPYYNKATDDGLVAHYMTVAHATSLPIILYNVPSRTGVDIPVSVYRRLMRIPNIVGIKEASTSISKAAKILYSCAEHLALYSGNDDMTVSMMALGAQGVISVVSNVAPAQTKAMVDAALSGDFAVAAAMQREMVPLTDLLFSQVNPIPVKAAMKCIGFDCGSCRLPLTDLTETEQKEMEAFFG